MAHSRLHDRKTTFQLRTSQFNRNKKKASRSILVFFFQVPIIPEANYGLGQYLRAFRGRILYCVHVVTNCMPNRGNQVRQCTLGDSAENAGI